jgi:C4-type Zn-finger protein
LVTLLGTFLNWVRTVLRLGSRRATRKSDAGERHSAKCPKCGEPDFRMSDRQRTRPEIYNSRSFRLKWLCLTCGYRTTEIIEEPN